MGIDFGSLAAFEFLKFQNRAEVIYRLQQMGSTTLILNYTPNLIQFKPIKASTILITDHGQAISLLDPHGCISSCLSAIQI